MAQGSIDNPMESTLTPLPGCPKDGVHLRSSPVFFCTILHLLDQVQAPAIFSPLLKAN